MKTSTKKPSAKPKSSTFSSRANVLVSPTETSLGSPTLAEEARINETRNNAHSPITYIQCELKRIDLNLIDPDFIRTNYTLVTKATEPQVDNPHSLISSLYDQRLGASVWAKKCTRCDDPDCCGHLGYLDNGDPEFIHDPRELIPPFIDPGLGLQLRQIVNVICRHCSRLMIPDGDYKRLRLDRMKTSHRVKAMENYAKDRRDNEDFKCSSINAEDATTNPGAQPRKIPECTMQYDGVVYNKDSNRLQRGIDLDNVELYMMLRRMSARDVERLGFGRPTNKTREDSRRDHPSWIMQTVIPLLPPSMRQAAPKDSDESNRQHFDQSYRFVLKEMTKARLEPLGEARNKTTDGINLRLLNIWSSQKGRPGARPNAATKARKPRGKGRGKNKDSGSSGKANSVDVKGAKEEITGKEGLVRQNLMGRRVDYSSRGVVTGDDSINLGQIGIPKAVWENSYDNIYVMEHNIDYFRSLYEDGVLYYYIPPEGYWRRHRVLVDKYVKVKGEPSFRVGDCYAVRMREGRIVIFNRNPSIHKVSTMSAEVVRTEYNTFRMSNPTTTPLNMDYDGDEANVISPQEPMSEAEVRILFSIPRNIVNTENAGPSMGAVMDALTTFYKATAVKEVGYAIVDADELAMLRSIPTERDDLDTLDARLAYHKIDAYSTRGMLSTLFPRDFNYSSKGVDDSPVRIQDGILIYGIIAKPQAGVSKMSIAQALYNRPDGRRRAMGFINDAMKMTDYYISAIAGLSVGTDDLELDNEEVRTRVTANQKRIDYLISMIDVPSMDEASRKRREIEAINTLQSNADAFGQMITKDVITPQNTVRAMIRSKAKGDIFHLSNIVAQGGQQYELGNRLQTNITGGRGSIFDPIGIRSVESRGFIKNSLGKGYDPRDQNSHHTASRVGLVDTSIKTSAAGETHRLQNESLMDQLVAQDHSLRDVNNITVQYVAGIVGLDPFHTVPQSFEGMDFGFFVDIDSLINDTNSELIDWMD